MTETDMDDLPSVKCHNCGFENPGGFKFCGNCGKTLVELDREATKEFIEGAPGGLKEKMETESIRIRGERRRVVVMFADISKFTQLSRDRDPEELKELINSVFSQLMDVVYKYEGYIDKIIGDCLMVLFGAPITHEDDSLRALFCAFELLDTIKEFGRKRDLELNLSIGIARGLCYAGEFGRPGEYTVIGKDVNLAQRLQEIADDGIIYTSKGIYELTRHRFDYQKLGELNLEGVGLNEVYRAVGLKERSRLQTPFVGRSTEMQKLRKQFNQAKDSRGRITFILGERGVGKSSLFLKFRDDYLRNEDIYLGEARAVNYLRDEFYFVLRTLLKSVIGISEGVSSEEAQLKLEHFFEGRDDLAFAIPYVKYLLSIPFNQMERALFESIKPEDRERTIESAISSLLVRLSEEKTIILVVEDAQYIDKSSSSFFKNFQRVVRNYPILILMLCWERLEGYYKKSPVIKLEPLSKNKVKKLLKIIFDDRWIQNRFLDSIYKLTRGNPLFVEEIVKRLKQDDLLDIEKKVSLKEGEYEIPDRIYDIILSRIDRLDDEEKGVLMRASVIGFEFTNLLLEEVCKMDIFKEAFSSLQEEDFIRYTTDISFNGKKGGIYRFKNEIFKDVSYSLILKENRKEYHRKTAEAIERLYETNIEQQLDKIVHHYLQAEDERASNYLYKSGNRKFSGFLLNEAMEDYEKYLEIKENDILSRKNDDELDRLLDVYHNIGSVYNYRGNYDEAISYFQKVEELTDKEVVRLRARRKIADCHRKASKYDLARDTLLNLESNIKKDEDLLGEDEYEEFMLEVSKIYIDLAWVNYRIGYQKETEQYFQKAIDTLEGLPTRREVELTKAEAYKVIAAQERVKDDIDEAYQYERKALDIYEKYEHLKGIATMYNNIISYYDSKSEYLTAIEYLEKSLNIDMEIGDMMGEAIGRLNLGIEYAYLGDYKTAMDYIDSYQEINLMIDNRVGEGWANEIYSDIYSEKDEYETALEHIDKAIEIFEEVGGIRKILEAKSSKVGVLIEMKEISKAEKLLNEIEPQIHQHEIFYIDRQLKEYSSDVHYERGEYEESEKMLFDLLDIYKDNPDNLSEIYYKLGEVYEAMGDVDKAEESYEKAKLSLNEFVDSVDDENLKETFLNKKTSLKILNR